MNTQKINDFIDLQIKANKAMHVYGEVPTYVLERLIEVGNELTPEEHAASFLTFSEMMEGNTAKMVLAELN
jgi:hypothetical protein